MSPNLDLSKGNGDTAPAANSRWRRRLLLVALALSMLFAGLFYSGKSGSDPLIYRNDFNVYYHAARQVSQGRDPYQSSLTPTTPYIYPPLLSELLVPLSLLPLRAAAFVWFLVGVSSIVAAGILSARAGALEFPAAVLPVALLSVLLVARFVLDNFSYGQVNTVIAGLVAASIYSYSRGRVKCSALLLGLACALKLTPLVLLVYHLARLRIRYVATTLLFTTVFTLLGLAPFGSEAPGVLQEFTFRTLANRQGYDFAYHGNQSLLGASARVFGRGPVTDPYDPVALAIGAVLCGLLALGARRAGTELGAAAPAVCAMVLLSPLSWKAHFVVLVVPAAFLWMRAMESRGRTRRALLSILFLVFLLLNLLSPRIVGLRAAEWADSHSIIFGCGLLIFAAALVLQWQHIPRSANLIRNGDMEIQ